MDCILAIDVGTQLLWACIMDSELSVPERKQVHLSSEIYHVGGGASGAYTGYKQGIMNDFRFVQLGETTLAGAAKLAMDALK